MEVFFAFIDETFNRRLDPPLSSCTALLVPAHRYDELRIGVYRAIDRELQPAPRRLVQPSELHWRNFLPEATAERKLEVLRRFAALVPEVGASLCRVGYFVTDKLQQDFPLDPDLHALAFFGLQCGLGGITQESLLVPVVDAGFVESFRPIVRSYSGSHRSTEMLRACGIDPGLKDWNFANQGEIFYADSEFSAPLQLVDVLGGIRSLVDTRRVDPEHPLPEFKEAVLAIAQALDEVMGFDRIIAMDCDGEIQGPVAFSHRGQPG